MNTEQHQRLCRYCGSPLNNLFVDLGVSPLANAYLTEELLSKGEMHYPLRVYVCNHCKLVQLEQFESPKEIFSNYAYFSSFSQSWLDHAKQYTAQMIENGYVKQDAFIAEIASNDGYLLKNFVEKGYQVLGIEPAQNIAEVANDSGILTIPVFFGVETAKNLIDRFGQADLLIANNVLAHVPDINDFVEGLNIFLTPDGVITIEFPHLFQLMSQKQFDTIYHEHFSYLSVIAVKEIFEAHGLDIFHIEELPTHGGSLRIYAKHISNQNLDINVSVQEMIFKECSFGLDRIETYQEFYDQVKIKKREILKTLIEIKKQGNQIVGYGAPAKGNTLLNYCGIGTEFIDYTVDKNPNKQGKYLPGSRIPVYAVEKILADKPKYVLILPWNLKYEIMQQMEHIRDWGGQFITLIPEIMIE